MSILIAASVMALTGTSAAIADIDVSADRNIQEIVLTTADAQEDVTNNRGITVPAEFESLINSEAPKTVTVDPATGIVESVVITSQQRSGDAGVTPGNCSGRPCWDPYYYPSGTAYGFVGTGTVYGIWSTRGNFYSNVREATICWNTTFGPTFCSWRMAPWTIWNFSDDTAVGRSVTLY